MTYRSFDSLRSLRMTAVQILRLAALAQDDNTSLRSPRMTLALGDRDKHLPDPPF
ncbi:MAG: hypothetical protein ABI625_15465 [bacterium]